MNKSQADAVVEALLKPDIEARESRRRKRATADQRRADQRLVAGLSLPCMAIGAVAAHFIGDRFTTGVICGGIAGGIIGWSFIWWRRRRSGS